ncbi:hypothetical protein HD554DRAFT_2170104 [Boletus coccyginus]|nr:hypothetical protein HD554DRAFT_2170104 [Boletus coccyginus]
MSLTRTRSRHGVAAVFEKLLPLAHAHNLRIVSVYRRGYPPSSGFHNDELVGIGLQKRIEDAEPFLRAQAAEIATFLVNFAMVQGIPLADPDPNDPNVGGIVLIGWSLGGVHVLALLAYLDELQADTQLTLRKYLHTVLSHDANALMLGIPSDVPRHDTSLWSETDDRKLFDAFFDWVTAHYTHKSVTSEDFDDLEFNHPSDIPHSLNDLSYSQRAEYTCPDAVSYAGCDRKLLFCDITTFAALTKRALFDEAHAKKFPNVRVRYMSGGTSSGALIWPLWMLRKYAENPPAELYGSDAEKARDVRFITQTEGNHFIFWEDPEQAIRQYTVAINL